MSDGPACVHCRQRPAMARWRPFCSERCRMADLGRWLRGDYRLAGEPVDADEAGMAAGNEARRRDEE